MDPNGLRHGVPDRAGKDLARVWNTSSTASPGHFWRKKRSEARNPKLDMVWCAATLGLVVKTKQVIKDSNNVMLTIIKTCLK